MRVGVADLEFLGNSGFMIKHRNKIIAIDPYHVSDTLPKADIILITHSHYDHCSIKDIQKMSKKGTIVLCPVDCQSTLMKVKNVDVHIVEKDDILDFRQLKIECVPAYTMHSRHSQNEGWLGYVIKFDRTVIYFAGDTDHIPEMHKLSGYGKKGNHFVIILPISGTVVMDALAAAKAARMLNPTIAIPMNYAADVNSYDAKKFVELCKQMEVKAEILPKI